MQHMRAAECFHAIFAFLFHDIAMLVRLSLASEAIWHCFSVLPLELVLSVSNGFGKQMSSASLNHYLSFSLLLVVPLPRPFVFLLSIRSSACSFYLKRLS